MKSIELFHYSFTIYDIIYFAFMFLAAGICIYTAIRLSYQKTFFKSQILVPGGCTAESCLNPEGYFGFIRVRLIVFGILILLCCVLEIVGTVLIGLGKLPGEASWFMVFPPIVLVLWFNKVHRKAAMLYWKK